MDVPTLLNTCVILSSSTMLVYTMRKLVKTTEHQALTVYMIVAILCVYQISLYAYTQFGPTTYLVRAGILGRIGALISLATVYAALRLR